MGGRDIRAAVLTAIARILPGAPSDDDEADLQEWGMTSIELMSLVIALEDELGICITDDLLDPENFSSIRKIVATVASLVPKVPEGL